MGGSERRIQRDQCRSPHLVAELELSLLQLGVKAHDGLDELGLLLEYGLGHALVQRALPTRGRAGAGLGLA